MEPEKVIINDSTTHIIKRQEQDLVLPDNKEVIPPVTTISAKDFKSQFFLLSTDNNEKIAVEPHQVSPQLLQTLFKMVSELKPGKKIQIRALVVDDKQEIEQRNKVLPAISKEAED